MLHASTHPAGTAICSVIHCPNIISPAAPMIHAPNSRAYQEHLTEWAIVVVEHAGEPTALQQASAAVPGAGVNPQAVVLRRLRKNRTLAAVSPPGRPRKYDDGVCAAAIEALKHHQVNLKDLLHHLEDGGVVEHGDRDTFSARLKDYCKRHNIYINTACHTTIFMVPKANAGKRIATAVEGLALLKEKHDIKDVVVLDEVICQSAPHQKSESIFWYNPWPT